MREKDYNSHIINFGGSPSPQKKAMAPHSSVLAWRIPGLREPGRLPSTGSHRVGHDWSDSAVGGRCCVKHVAHIPSWLSWRRQNTFHAQGNWELKGLAGGSTVEPVFNPAFLMWMLLLLLPSAETLLQPSAADRLVRLWYLSPRRPVVSLTLHPSPCSSHGCL